jgi:hypothetical protein
MFKILLNTLLLAICCYSTNAQYLYPVAGKDTCGYLGDGGKARDARIFRPQAICIDRKGNIYFTQQMMEAPYRVVIRKISVGDSIISTVAGPGGLYDTADNIPATSATLNYPATLASDTAGNIYFADGITRVRKIDVVTGLISTVAGKIASGIGMGYSGDGGPAVLAQLHYPYDVQLDSLGNLYITDVGNHCIRKVDAVTHIISTVAGVPPTWGLPVDGIPATSAYFYRPTYLHIDRQGNMYIWEQLNYCLRKIDASTGLINTVATATTLDTAIRALTGDPYGNIYASSAKYARIRKMDAVTHAVSTYAGYNIAWPTTGKVNSSAWGGKADTVKAASFGLCFDTCGNLYLTRLDGEIAVITPTAMPPDCYAQSHMEILATSTVEGMHIAPNPTSRILNFTIYAAEPELAHVVVTNAVGQRVNEFDVFTNREHSMPIDMPTGMYFIHAASSTTAWSGKLMVR